MIDLKKHDAIPAPAMVPRCDAAAMDRLRRFAAGDDAALARVTCLSCGWTGDEDEVEHARDPFCDEQTVEVCPECREAEQLRRATDHN